jgi:hypothetical protein
LRAFLGSPDSSLATEALDALVATALDASAERALRMIAFDALQDTAQDVRARVADALKRESPDAFQMRFQGAEERMAADALWNDALGGSLPGSPRILRDLVAARAHSTPLASLQKLVDKLRATESNATAEAREEWQAVRGAVHQALAIRGSRVALYDLRESIAEASGRIPVSFLAALHLVGDASCLEALALAYSRAPADEDWSRYQLASAFRAIVKREKVTRRHVVLKRIARRWPETVSELTGAASAALKHTF